MEIALSSIGGSMQAFMHRGLVKKRGWMTDEDFLELLGLCRMIPGPTMVNIALYVGARKRGAKGAIAGFLGILLVPVLCAATLMSLAVEFAHYPAVKSALNGMGAASAGLTIAMALQLAEQHSRRIWAVIITCVVFALIAFGHWSMGWIVLGGVLASMSGAAWQLKKEVA